MLGMKKIVLPLASVVLVVLLLSGSYPGSTEDMSKAQAQTATAPPNIVFILTDDMRKDDLKYMPKTKALLQNKGMTFENAFVSHAVCCPSRATIMRGQYAHNTGVLSNSATDSSSTTSGGWQAYKANGNEADNVATRLKEAGYRTGLFGKYLNGYMDTTTDIPDGWDRWFATQGDYFNYDANDQGTIKHFGTTASDYQTDVIRGKTNTFISYSASLGKPFFAYVTPKAPHLPATPAPRYVHTIYDGVKAPRLPSFDEADVSDKPPWIRQLPRLSATQKASIDSRHEDRVETLQAVDDLVEGVVNSLNNAKVMNNTYVFFTSDNGWHEGEHRIPLEKWRPYEEDIHMPLLVRGPDPAVVGADPEVRPGTTTYKLTLNTDYLPTFTELAGAQTPPYVDGRSLKPVLNENATTWRNAILLEAAAKAKATYSPAYAGIRTVNSSTTNKGKYVEYSGTERELYDLNADPYERANKYPATKPSSGLVSRLQALKGCKYDGAVTCQAAEDGQ
jgi:N-acetylglucosamine-6-sulfatase